MSMMQMLLGAAGTVSYPADTYWVKVMDKDGATYSGRQYILALDSDNDGNIYAVGTRLTMSGAKGGLTLTKFDVEGAITWQKGLISDPSGDYQIVGMYGVSVTDDGASIYTTTESDEGAMVTRWNSSGVIQFQRQLGSGNVNDNSPFVMPLTSSDAPTVWMRQYTTTPARMVMMRLTNAGATTWQTTIGATGYNSAVQTVPQSGGDIDSSGNVYMPVFHAASSGTTKYCGIAKWNSSGVHQDTFVYNTVDGSSYTNSAPGEDMLRHVAVDSSGNMYAACKFKDSSVTHYKVTLMKLNSSGVIQWQRTVMHTDTYLQAFNLRVTSDDEVIWCIRDQRTGYAYLFLRYQADGTLVYKRELYVSGETMGYDGSMNINRNDNILFSWEENGDDDTQYLAQLPGDGSLTGTHGDFIWQDADSDISIATTSYWGVSTGDSFTTGTTSLANTDLSSDVQTVTNTIVEESIQAVD